MKATYLALIMLLASSALTAQEKNNNKVDTVSVPKTESSDPITKIDLYYQEDGSPGNSIQNWYAKNKTSNKKIQITVQFWKGQIEINPPVTQTYTLNPGQIKSLRARYSGGGDIWNARLVGAIYQ